MTAAGTARPRWARTLATSIVVGLVTFGTLLTGMVALAPGAAAADDSSAVTVTAQQQDPDLATAPFPDLSVTVSQTRDLTSQGIRLTYSGGVRSQTPSLERAGANFLQIVQCWGDVTDANGDLVLDQNGQPQPDRTTCQYGSTGAPGQSRTATKSGLEFVSPEDEPYLSVEGDPRFDPPEISIPFRSVTGKTLERIVDGHKLPNVNLDNNEFFTRLTTNEVAWAGFDARGTGTATFEVQTNMQAPGLGCGNPIEGAGGTVTGRPCWLVVIPRGVADFGEASVIKSGLLWETWEHRLAVRLEFKPLGVRCALGAAERSVAGSELLALAMSSWQPSLCGSQNGSIYNLVIANEADELLAANDGTDPRLAITLRALSEPEVTDSLTYAPIAITGLTVAFAVDHRADPFGQNVPSDVKDLDRQPFTQMNLTPRLLAKLLTNSYKNSLPTYSDIEHLGDNPTNLTTDPEFLEINPAWAHQAIVQPSLADVFVPLGRSDAAWAVWSYVVTDPEARDFLAGTPDPWGMVVNPWASTTETPNPKVGVQGSPTFGIPVRGGVSFPRDDFPKFDPTWVDLIGDEYGRSVINVITWRPYASDLDTGAYWVLRGDERRLGDWDGLPTTGVPRFKSTDRSVVGLQKVAGLTGGASAAKYQVYTAALRNPAGKYVEPTTASMAAAAAAMTADSSQPQVRRFDPSSTQAKAAPDAYPLTVPIYAATDSDGGDAAARAAYAAFIRYAAGAGQTPGTNLGQLPLGYTPLPDDWRAQALAAADKIAAGPAPTPTPTPTPVPTASLPQSTPPAGYLPVTNTPPSQQSTSPEPSPTPTPTAEPPGAVVGAATPDDDGVGALGAAVPISAAGGLLAAAVVPFATRPRRVS